jgi:hypothetical protein
MELDIALSHGAPVGKVVTDIQTDKETNRLTLSISDRTSTVLEGNEYNFEAPFMLTQFSCL